MALPPNFGSNAERSVSGTLTPIGGSVVGGVRTPPGARTPTGGEKGPNVEGATWEEDKPHCGACGTRFGTGLGGQRKHHCRICGRCVCNTCSQSKIMLDGWSGPQRACTPCVSVAPRAQKVRSRVARVGQQLHAIQDPEGGLEDPATLEDAVTYCEEAVAPLQVSQSRATSDVLAVTEKLQALATQEEVSLPSCEHLDEALRLLEAVVEPVEARISELEAELKEERALRVELEAVVARAATSASQSSATSHNDRSWRRVPPSPALGTPASVGPASVDGGSKKDEKCVQTCAVM